MITTKIIIGIILLFIFANGVVLMLGDAIADFFWYHSYNKRKKD